MDLGPPLAHVVLDVEDERLLAEVGVDDLAGSLKSDGGIQVGLRAVQVKCFYFYFNRI